MNWKYTDHTNRIVARINEDGSMESKYAYLTSPTETIEPADIIPPTPKSVTPLAFMEYFTDEEQLTIVTVAQSTPPLRLWYDKLMAAQEVVEGDARIISGMEAIAAAGLLSPERKDEILARLTNS